MDLAKTTGEVRTLTDHWNQVARDEKVSFSQKCKSLKKLQRQAAQMKIIKYKAAAEAKDCAGDKRKISLKEEPETETPKMRSARPKLHSPRPKANGQAKPEAKNAVGPKSEAKAKANDASATGGTLPVGSCTAVVTHAYCWKHNPGQHIETEERLEGICGPKGILRGARFGELKWCEDPPKASLADILRIHTFDYVQMLQHCVIEATSRNALVPITSNPHIKQELSDTWVCAESFEASRHAAGCVIKGVELVCSGQFKHVFCAVRPPGHHVGPEGVVNSGPYGSNDVEDPVHPDGSQGFCLLNNVAIGAAFARDHYRHQISRLAIIDFDVHHGNGTEAVVDPLNLTIRPWLEPDGEHGDKQSIFFASIHAFNGKFYPNSGKSTGGTWPSDSSPIRINIGLHRKFTIEEFRACFENDIIKPLDGFRPDLILLSAGFDGHKNDRIGGACLDAETYAWLTKRLMCVASLYSNGRMVSVLEGGYATKGGHYKDFGECVAQHVAALMSSDLTK